VEVFLVHREHLVHAREVDRHAALHREDVALERGADAERNHRHTVAAADLDHVAHLFGRRYIDNRIRQCVREVRLVLAVVLAYGGRSRHPVAEQGLQLLEDGGSEFAGLVHANYSRRISPSNGTRTPSEGISRVHFTGTPSPPFSFPDWSAFCTACSISRCELTPTSFRNLRMLRLKVSWSISALLSGFCLQVLCPARRPTGRSC